jgi:hypothetical protein
VKVVFVLKGHVMRGFLQKFSDGLFGNFISFSQIFVITTGTNPSERSKPKFKDIAHDIFDIRRILKLVNTILGVDVSFGQRGLIKETVSVVPESHTLFGQLIDRIYLPDKRLFNEGLELFSVSCYQVVRLFDCESNRIIPTAQRIMKRCLVRAKVNDILLFLCKSFP